MEIKRNLNRYLNKYCHKSEKVSISYGDKEKFEQVFRTKQFRELQRFQSPMEIKRNLNLEGDNCLTTYSEFQSPMEIKRNLNDRHGSNTATD